MSNWAEPSGTLPRSEPSAGLFTPVNLASRTDLDEPASEEDDEKSMSADWNELRTTVPGCRAKMCGARSISMCKAVDKKVTAKSGQRRA